MADLAPICRDSVEAQADAFRLAKRDGFDVDVLHHRSKIPASTLKGWASGRTAMPAWAAGFLIAKGFPPEHMSLIYEPFRVHFASDEEGDEEAFYALQEKCLDFLGIKAAARSKRSPGGPAIVVQEKSKLRTKAGEIATVARRAARVK
jgi:hypothetical protein